MFSHGGCDRQKVDFSMNALTCNEIQYTRDELIERGNDFSVHGFPLISYHTKFLHE